ncbi:hypothetical protein [Halioxenophilus aromaticivorans]|uniref:Uncharacterized protein n=1 Tax=Halioxenophilus aromaticivorans TaxID=1306992 RepID=A0AAV3U924_9ALTE
MQFKFAPHTNAKITNGLPVAQALVLMCVIALLALWTGGEKKPIITQIVRLGDVAGSAQLDFNRAEAGWSELSWSRDGRLLIDNRTEPALSALVETMVAADSLLKSQRISILLEKQFGQRRGQQVVTLVNQLVAFKKREQAWLSRNADQTPPPFAELMALQDEAFGADVAAQLFAGQRQVMQVILNSQSAPALQGNQR